MSFLNDQNSWYEEVYLANLYHKRVARTWKQSVASILFQLLANSRDDGQCLFGRKTILGTGKIALTNPLPKASNHSDRTQAFWKGYGGADFSTLYGPGGI